MRKGDWEILFSDFPDKENLVCEIWHKDAHWADVSEEVRGNCIVLFANKRDGNHWEFPYDEAIDILKKAREQLKKTQRTSEQQLEASYSF